LVLLHSRKRAQVILVISLDFRDKNEANELKKNLSSLVYEVQHRPKEIVSYNIVTEFNLNKDGTISVKCPYCGAPAPLHSKESEVVCKYCGKTYIIPKKILDLIS
jgi:primosomal protein N'